MDYLQCLKEVSKINDSEKNKKINIAILRSYSCENIEIPLRAILHREGYNANVFWGGYNQYYQEIMDEHSFLYTENVDIVIILLRNEDILYKNTNTIEVVKYYKDMIEQIKSKSNVKAIIVSNYDEYYQEYNLCEYRDIRSNINIIKEINYKLIALASEYKNIFILDINKFINILGRKNAYDYKMKYMYENPYKINMYIEMVKYIERIVNAIYYNTKKVIAVDMDNTLYNGILGEDGKYNISIYNNYPNNCYLTIQKKLKQLKELGFLIAIVSKNNIEDVHDFFHENKNMLLKEDDFVCIKANWNEKWKNLIDISKEINVGIDSFIFIDDSEYEIELMNKRLPNVETILLPRKIYEIDEVLNNIRKIDKVNVTDEDKNKTAMYHRRINNIDNNKLEEFLEGLDIVVKIKNKEKLSNAEIDRVSEMTLKTNQFNMTSNRYTVTDIEKMINDKNWEILLMSEKDKYGEQGNVGLAILKDMGEKIIIDTFLLSCRVLKRNVEYVLFNKVVDLARKNNKMVIEAPIVKNSKNKAFINFYRKAGMSINDSTTYKLVVNNYKGIMPQYIKIEENE